MQPTTGTVERRGRLAALLELGAGFHPDLTGRENVYLNASILGLSPAGRPTGTSTRSSTFSGIEQFIDTQVKFYSSGMYVRLAFAVAVHVDPDMLLVDEVLAVGDEPFQRKCMDRIRAFQKRGPHHHAGHPRARTRSPSSATARSCSSTAASRSTGRPRTPCGSARGLRGARQADLARLAAASPQDAAAAARFTGISVRSDDSEGGRPVVDEGETITIAMEVRSDAELRDWSIEVGIATPLGNPLFVTTTEMLGIDLAPLQGTRQFTLTLPKVHLGSGDYAVRTTLRSSDGAEIHYVPVGAQFSVRTAGSSRGHVFMPAIFEAH